MSATDIIWAFTGKDEIRTELTVSHFRIDFAYVQFKIRPLTFECCGQSLFQSTGGSWIFVLDKDGKKAYRRKIKIGRQNPQYYEVIDFSLMFGYNRFIR